MFASPSPGLLVLLVEHLVGAPLVAEGRTTCAREGATTRCWGEHEFLYGAGVTDVPTPRKWALKGHHRCALAEGSGLRCDTSLAPTGLRVDDPDERPLQDFALTSDGGCMLGVLGLVACWRWDLGDRAELTGAPQVVPDARRIVVGGEPRFASPCVLTGAGAVVCWTPKCPIAPHVVMQDVVALAGDHHLCAARRDGSVTCWRAPESCSDVWAESHVEGIEDAASVAVGEGLACALQSRGGVTCWSMDEKGRPGRPRSIPGTTHATSVAVGEGHACIRDVDGQVWCWGDNSSGQLGQYEVLDELTEPTAIPELDDAVALAGNLTSTCALLAGGRIACWGRDYESSEGQWNATPSVRADLPPALRLFPFGNRTMCAELRGGEIRCWGEQPGADIRRPNTAITEILGNAMRPLVCIRSLDRAATCTFGVDQGGSGPASLRLPRTDLLAVDALGVIAYGVTRPGYWQIREDWRSGSRDWFSASFLVTELAVSYHQVCAVDIRGTVVCADRLEHDVLSPARSMDLVDVIGLSAGSEHICALDSHGQVHCWGDNSWSQLGQGTEERGSATPLRVPGVENVIQVSAVMARTCALLGGGSVTCWGNNLYGSSGVGDGASSPDPVPVRPPLAAIHGTENLTLFLPSTPLK